MAKVGGEEWPCKAAVMDSPPCDSYDRVDGKYESMGHPSLDV